MFLPPWPRCLRQRLLRPPVDLKLAALSSSESVDPLPRGQGDSQLDSQGTDSERHWRPLRAAPNRPAGSPPEKLQCTYLPTHTATRTHMHTPLRRVVATKSRRPRGEGETLLPSPSP